MDNLARAPDSSGADVPSFSQRRARRFMMAFDRSQSSNALDPDTLTELRSALARSAQSGGHGDELKGLLARAAAEAKQRGVQAEQLLVVLKDIWYSLPHLSTQPGSDVQTRLLQQLIARCIQEYYAT